MQTSITAEFFTKNRQRLRKITDTELIIIAANGLLQRSSDTTFPFRQDSYFWYLTGLQNPDLLLVMDGPDEYLIVPERDAVLEMFDGKVEHATATKTSGVIEVLNEKDGWERLEKRLKAVPSFATLQPAPVFIERYDFYSNPSRAHLVQRLKAIKEMEIVDLRIPLARMRMVKQEPELKMLQQAIDITNDTLAEVMKNIDSFVYEYEIEAALAYGFRKRGAEGQGFEPIVASGEHSCQIHYTANSGKVDKKGLLLFDVSAEVSNYAADVSRTISLATPTKRQQAVFDAVLRVYTFAKKQLKPGVLMRDYETAVETYMGEELQKLGIIKEQTREAIRQYYPHATSHHLGLDAHDAADYDYPLGENMVVTVEPGIYLPAEGIGIRVEDDLLIQKSGMKVLSSSLPLVLR